MGTSSNAAPRPVSLSGGLHHIIITQGTQLLTQEQPPIILSEIIRKASLGQNIPTDIPPIIAHRQDDEGQTNVIITASAAPTKNDEGGNLLRTLPPIFSEDRTKAQAFLDVIAIWRAINYKKEVMKDPYMQTVLILTFIKGEKMTLLSIQCSR